MQGVVIRLDAADISDWTTFHAVFKRELGFPAYYGANMNAWIDCMTYIDDIDSGMTSVGVAEGELAILEVSGIRAFQQRCPEQYAALIECSAFVNFRRVDRGGTPVLALTLIG